MNFRDEALRWTYAVASVANFGNATLAYADGRPLVGSFFLCLSCGFAALSFNP